MPSPPVSPSRNALQGASRTTGGVLHGQAYGNIFNHADGDGEVHIAPRKGKVLIYQSPRDPTTNTPDMSIMSEVTPHLKPVLKNLSQKFLPVRSKFCLKIRMVKIFYTSLELNS